MRVATVDIGTNTVLLLVAERARGGPVRAVAEHATITRLGEGVDRTRRLSPAAVARTRQCLEAYARIAREHGSDRVSVVGTSAMRDAGGGDEVRADIQALFGVDVRVLSGDEEARLTFRGALSGLAAGESSAPVEDRQSPNAGGGNVAVFDIGGGSTEVVIGQLDAGHPRIAFAASYDVGSVRLTERYVSGDPPTAEALAAVAADARAAFRDVPHFGLEDAPVGVAGTMTTLAAVSLGLASYDAARVHGHQMNVDELRSTVDRLSLIPLEARGRVPGVDPRRADVIVAGGILALALLDHWKATKVRVSDRGVRWGLAEELLS